jgi:hypothetical protein
MVSLRIGHLVFIQRQLSRVDLHKISRSSGRVIRFLVCAFLDSEVVLFVVVVCVILVFLLIKMVLKSLREPIRGLVNVRFAAIFGIEFGTESVSQFVVKQQRIEMLLEVFF